MTTPEPRNKATKAPNLRDIDRESLPPYPSAPFCADDIIAFMQGQLRSYRIYYHNDSDFFEAVQETALEKGPQYAISKATIKKLMTWERGRAQTFGIHTLEAIWKGLV